MNEAHQEQSPNGHAEHCLEPVIVVRGGEDVRG